MNAVAQTTADEAMAFGDVIDPNQLATIHQGGGGRVDLPEIDMSNTMADVGLATGAFARRDTRVEAVNDTVIEEATRQPFSKRVGDENIAGEPNVTTATSPTRTIDADVVRDRSSGTARRVEETTRGAEREFVDEFTVDAPTNEGVPTTVKEIEPVVAAETAATTEIYEDAVISGELASQEENPAFIEADETEFENDEDVLALRDHLGLNRLGEEKRRAVDQGEESAIKVDRLDNAFGLFRQSWRYRQTCHQADGPRDHHGAQ